MEMLGHRDIKTTLIYTRLIQFESDDFHSAVAETVEGASDLHLSVSAEKVLKEIEWS